MTNTDENSTVYSRDVLEFVTVAVQYCAYLETLDTKTRQEFVGTLLKLLPLLYLKASLLNDNGINNDGDMWAEEPEQFVTEENYEIIRNNIAYIMGEQDDYLDVFVEDMKYSDRPILRTVSEELADIYQDIKNFAYAYKIGTDETMQAALSACNENFKTYWGQKLVNVMRALHDVKYNPNNEAEDDGCCCDDDDDCCSHHEDHCSHHGEGECTCGHHHH